MSASIFRSQSGTSPHSEAQNRPLLAVIVLGAVLIGQLLTISLLYTHAFEFTCRYNAPAFFCQFLSQSVIRVICIAGVLALFAVARPVVLGKVWTSQRAQAHRGWMLAQGAGFVMCLLPWLFLRDPTPAGLFELGAALWLVGGALAACGALFILYPPRAWQDALVTAGFGLPIMLGLAALAPEFAAGAQQLWAWDPLAELTFFSVEMMIEQVLGYQVASDAPNKLILLYSFGALVGSQCSGIEGFMLITAFLAFYMWLFRQNLKFPRVLILFPIGLMLSWIFNVVRIAALIVIGEEFSPELALNGFHSHAGWLMFTILSISLAIVAHLIPWFRADGADTVTAPRAAASGRASTKAPLPPFFEDMNVVQILPFIVFMASGLIASTFTETPGIYYPMRLVAMIAVLALVWRALLKIDWRIDPLALGAGVALGAIWAVTSPPPDTQETAFLGALGAMSAGAFVFWAATRVIGTIVFVPIIEELFFRGYVMRRIDTGGILMRVLAIAISAGLFAYLHDRWMLAFAAGVLFSLLLLRRGKIADAIWAHVGANAVVAGWAVATGDWAAI